MAQLRFRGVRNETGVGVQQGKAGAVRGAVEDAGVGAALGDLLGGAGDRSRLGAVDFVLPADEDGGGKPGAQLGKDFAGGLEPQGERSEVGGCFLSE